MTVGDLTKRYRNLKIPSALSSFIGGAKRRVFSKAYLDLGGDCRDSILLASSPRSGSTWISNVINYRNDYRSIFEPFYSRHVPICRDFRQRQYLRPDNSEDRYLNPARLIVAGRIRNKWVDQYNQHPFARKRLIKDVRVNLFLKWIHTNFPEVPIVLLLRHPCAVANSRTSKGWSTHLDDILSQEDLIEDFLSPFMANIEDAKSEFERQIYLWCIENYVPLKQFKASEIHLAFYENFCAFPQQEFERLLRYLNIDIDDRIYRRAKQPVSVRRNSSILSGDSLEAGWRKHVSAEQMSIAADILGLFGLDKIYSGDPMPDALAARELMVN